MIKMKKISLLLFTMLLSFALIAGCGGSDSDNSGASPTATPTPTTSAGTTTTPTPATTAVTWTATDWTSATYPTGWGYSNTFMESCLAMEADNTATNTTALYFDASANPASLDSSVSSTYAFKYASASLTSTTTSYNFTIAFRAKADSSSTYGWVLDFNGPFRGGVAIEPTQVEILNGSKSSGTAYTLTGTEWHTYYITFALTASGLTINVYVDAATTATLSYTATTSTTNAYIRLGDTSTTVDFKGYLDWIFYSEGVALGPGEVLSVPYSL